MSHSQYWANRLPTSLFEQTLFEADQMFYATFPAARQAACSQNLYDPDYLTSHDGVQSVDYDIRNEQVPEISSPSLPSAQQLSYPLLHFDYSRRPHPQQLSSSHYQSQPSYYSLPIENNAPVYIPPNQPYYHQHSSNSMSPHIPQSPPGSVSPEPTPFLVNQLSNTGNIPHTNSGPQETISNGCPPESPEHKFRQLNRHMKPPTLKFTNNCQLAVMRLDQLSEHSHSDPSKNNDKSSSKTLHVSSGQITPTPTEFLLNSPKSPSIGLSSLPSKNLPERKPPLACLFCRGRKIACGPPLPGSIKKTCNQCRKRSLQCHYPSESRRGMRKKKPPSSNSDATFNIKSQK